VGSGGSAGATNALATGITLENDYKTELSLEQDPTLATTHLNQSSSLAVVYTHWSSDGEIALALEHNGGGSRYTTSNPPVIEFHGTADTTINISHALAVQHQYNQTGVPYELHALQGCPHGSWAYGCMPPSGDHPCQFLNGTAGYCSTMDEQAWPFISEHLGL
jgi:predicted esterase